MTGEIFLKKGPTVIEKNKPITQNDKFNILSQNLDELDSADEFIDFMVKDLESVGESNKHSELDYTGCNSFWMSVVNDDGIYMIEKINSKTTGITKIYNTKEEVDKDFIRLRVFLEKAKYIGKKIIRTELLEDSQGELYSNYMYTPALILYAKGDCSIVLQEFNSINEEEFSVMPSQFISDGKFEIMDGATEKYKNPTEVYSKILKQLTNEQTKTL